MTEYCDLLRRMSFGVGWGPKGIFVHSGVPVGKVLPCPSRSTIYLERVGFDNVVRNEKGMVIEQLIDYAFVSPLLLHESMMVMNYQIHNAANSSLNLLKLEIDPPSLSSIFHAYLDLIAKQWRVPGMPRCTVSSLIHQQRVWELMRILTAEKDKGVQRGAFSDWLRNCVIERAENELEECYCYLEKIYIHLTCHQLDAATKLAISTGDVRLSCLLSQAGSNRADFTRQLEFWKLNGLDFNLVDKHRVRIYELLAGSVVDQIQIQNIDWMKFLGLLTWYSLPPDASLPTIFHSYKQFLDDGKAPFPQTNYVIDGKSFGISVKHHAKRRIDFIYYLILLHVREINKDDSESIKKMFNALSSTDDPLDYHMIWHYREMLEAVGYLSTSSDYLYAVDMGFVSQLLSLGQCHWAIYVVLRMPRSQDFPFLQATVIREILLQYCETWCSQDSQRKFIKDLGVPLAWMHEARAIYFSYDGNFLKAVEYFVKYANWQKAHLIFITCVAHSLFLSDKHSDIQMLATSMEGHKSEIENWDSGAGIFLSFYSIRSSILGDDNIISELDSLKRKNTYCKELVRRLSDSLTVWRIKEPVDAKLAYFKMADEISALLLINAAKITSCVMQSIFIDSIMLLTFCFLLMCNWTLLKWIYT